MFNALKPENNGRHLEDGIFLNWHKITDKQMNVTKKLPELGHQCSFRWPDTWRHQDISRYNGDYKATNVFYEIIMVIGYLP